MFQDILGHHVGTVVAQEHFVGNDIRANLQLGRRVFGRIIIVKRSTVTTAIDGTTDNGLLCFRTNHTDRHRFSIGTEGTQSLHGWHACGYLIIQVAIDVVSLQSSVISIGIRPVTTTIDITLDTAVDTHGITAIDITGYIVSTIDVVDVACLYQHAGRITGGEESAINGLFRDIILIRVHIGHSATAEDVVNLHASRLDGHVDSC